MEKIKEIIDQIDDEIEKQKTIKNQIRKNEYDYNWTSGFIKGLEFCRKLLIKLKKLLE